eukprot:scaffold1736_cov127-Cylindrotheca_fusiformis.AAC.49
MTSNTPNDSMMELVDPETEGINGYSCTEPENVAPTEPHVTVREPFYFEFLYPIEEKEGASSYLQSTIAGMVASKYNISTGVACLADEPLTQDHSWLVSFQTSLENLTMFPSCKLDGSFDPEIQDCFFARLNITGIVVGQRAVMPDVVGYVEDLLHIKFTSSSSYSVDYFGGKGIEEHLFDHVDDKPRDNLDPAKGNDDESDQAPLTAIGIAMVSLLGFTLLVLIWALRRKRRLRKRIQQKKLQKQQSEEEAERAPCKLKEVDETPEIA